MQSPTVEPRVVGGQDVCPECRRRFAPAGERDGGRFGLSVLLLVGAFVLLGLFFALVVFVKTQGSGSPTTSPYQFGPGVWQEERDPWGQPGGFATKKWEPPPDRAWPTGK